MPCSGKAKQGKSRRWKEKQGGARGGPVASKHQAGVQNPRMGNLEVGTEVNS